MDLSHLGLRPMAIEQALLGREFAVLRIPHLSVGLVTLPDRIEEKAHEFVPTTSGRRERPQIAVIERTRPCVVEDFEKWFVPSDEHRFALRAIRRSGAAKADSVS